MKIPAAFPGCWQFSSQMPTIQFLLDKEREASAIFGQPGSIPSTQSKAPWFLQTAAQHSPRTDRHGRGEKDEWPSSRSQDPTTAVRTPVRRDCWACWFSTYALDCATWAPLSFQPSCQAQFQVSNDRDSSVTSGKRDQNIFTVWKTMYF